MAEMGPTTAIPQGVHLLVDAQVFVAEADGVISVDYQVNVLSGGTMGCAGANIVVTWPEPRPSPAVGGGDSVQPHLHGRLSKRCSTTGAPMTKGRAP